MDRREMCYEGARYMKLAQDRVQRRVSVIAVLNVGLVCAAAIMLTFGRPLH
jgi:hypothetical protein